MRLTDFDQSAVGTTSSAVGVLELNAAIATEQTRQLVLEVERPGRIDGLLLWAKLWPVKGTRRLTPDVATNWGTIFFPLFVEPMAVAAGDRRVVTFTASLSDDRVHPDYRAEAQLRTAAGTATAVPCSDNHGGRFGARGVYRDLFPELTSSEVGPKR